MRTLGLPPFRGFTTGCEVRPNRTLKNRIDECAVLRRDRTPGLVRLTCGSCTPISYSAPSLQVVCYPILETWIGTEETRPFLFLLTAVTHAAVDYSDYYEVIRRTNNLTCTAHIESAIRAIDDILDKGPVLSLPLKALFGLQGLEHDDDFVSVLEAPLGGVQATNWDARVSSTTWDEFCEKISSGGAGMQLGLIRVPAEVVNFASWVRETVLPFCPKEMTVEDVSSTCLLLQLARFSFFVIPLELTSLTGCLRNSALVHMTIPSFKTRPF